AISVRNTDTNQIYTTGSTSSGRYAAPNLPPGTYEVTVLATGFAKYTQTGVGLSVGQTATLDIVLRLENKEDEITIVAEKSQLEPTRTEVSHVIDTQQIASLPISGRLFTDFVLLSPGVATGRTSLQSTITEFEVTRVAFGGMRDLSN